MILHPRARFVAAAVTLGIVIGALAYKSCVRGAVDDVEAAFRKSPAFEILHKDPLADIGGAEQRITDQHVLRLLQLMSLARDTDTEAPAELAKAHRELDDNKPARLDAIGIDFIVRLAGKYGADGTFQQDFKPEIPSTHLARILAGRPQAMELYRRCVGKNKCEDPDDDHESWTFMAPLRRWGWGDQGTSQQILEVLFRQMRVVQTMTSEVKANSDRRKDYRLFAEYSQRLLSALASNDGVRREKFWVALWMGPEQLLMFIVFCIVTLLLICRTLCLKFEKLRAIDKRNLSRTPDEDLVENERGRWLVRWLARALPSLGFIGTVRGLAVAIGNADTIVTAGNSVEQGAAISTVSASLSLAFTTTLIALVMGLVVSFANDLLVVAERRVLTLSYRLKTKDPAKTNGATAVVATGPAKAEDKGPEAKDSVAPKTEGDESPEAKDPIVPKTEGDHGP